jgi:hypothetical protein
MTTRLSSYGFKTNIGSYAGSDTRVLRTLQDRLNDIINVRDWGALGDGSHDDTDRITAALTYAFTLSGRRAVFFPPGIYVIGNPPLIFNPVWPDDKPRISIFGAGRDVSIIKGEFGNTQQADSRINSYLCRVKAYVPGSPAVMRISDLTIWNDSKVPASGALHFDFTGGGQQVLRCHLHGFNGLALQGSTMHTSVRDCKATCSVDITAASAATRAPGKPMDYWTKFTAGTLLTIQSMSWDPSSHKVTVVTQAPHNLLVEYVVNVAVTANGNSPWWMDNSQGNVIVSDVDNPTQFKYVGPSTPPSNFISGTYRCPVAIGSVGFYLETGHFINNHAEGFDVGIAGNKYSGVYIGNKASRCGIGFAGAFAGNPVTADFYLPDPPGPTGATTSNYFSNKIERCTWGMLINDAWTTWLANVITGKRSGAHAIASPYDEAAISTMSWDNISNDVTVNTQDAHNLSIGSVVQLAVTTTGGSNPWTNSTLGIVTVTSVPSGSSFKYAGPSTPPSTFDAGSWNYPAEYGAVVAGLDRSLLGATAMDELEASGAGILLKNPGVNPLWPLSVQQAQVWAERPLRGWSLGSTPVPDNLAGADYKMCGMPGTNNNPYQYLTFASLPRRTPLSGTISDETVTEGIEATITDAQTAAMGTAVAGGGSNNHYKVRWDNSGAGAWIRVA